MFTHTRTHTHTHTHTVHTQDSNNNIKNWYKLKLNFIKDVGLKDIHCMIVRIKDVSANNFIVINHTVRPPQGIVYYYTTIRIGLMSENQLFMGHHYETTVIINVGWCSLDYGGMANARAGDMRALNLERVSGRPLSTGTGLRYTISVNMEIVN